VPAANSPPPEDPLGTPADVLARLRLRARLTKAADQSGVYEGTGGAWGPARRRHRRPRLQINRRAVPVLSVAAGLVAVGFLIPALAAGSGTGGNSSEIPGQSSIGGWEPVGGAAGLSSLAPSGDGSGQDGPAAQLVVHVAGAVTNPGVYQLDQAARVIDAVDAAGGAVAGADLGVLNLAAPVGDGERIYVPLVGETPPPVLGGSDGAGSLGGVNGGSGSGRINVNTASASELTDLPGVGPVLAERIVAFRNANGPFGELADLGEVSGIGPKVLAGLADSVSF
jgi:competence protein ComEA